VESNSIPHNARTRFYVRNRLNSLHDIDSLGSLIALSDLELDRLAFIESLKAVALDCTVMDKHVATAFFLDKTVTFCVIEPLHLASCHLPNLLHTR
jgi:hypothetical protein